MANQILKNQRTNWKFLAIVIILAAAVGGGIWWCAIKDIVELSIINFSTGQEVSGKKEIEFVPYCDDGLRYFKKINLELYQDIIEDLEGLFGVSADIYVPNCDLGYLQIGYIDIDGDNKQEIIVEFKEKDAYSSYYLIIYKQTDEDFAPILSQRGFHLSKVYIDNDQLVVKSALYKGDDRSDLIFPPKYRYIYYKFIDDELKADKIIEESVSLERITEDPKFCQEIVKLGEEEERKECFQLLLEHGDSSLCEYFELNEDKNECYWNFAKYKGDQSSCKKITFDPYKNACYIYLAFSLKDNSLCEEMNDFNITSDIEIKYNFIKKPLNFLKSKEVCRDISSEGVSWKLYQNQKYGYEIQYPSNFTINLFTGEYPPLDVEVSFTPPERVIEIISPYPRSWGSSGCVGQCAIGGEGDYEEVSGDLIWIGTEKAESEEKLEEWIRKQFSLEEFKEFKEENVDYYSNLVSIEKIIIGDNLQGYKVETQFKGDYHTYRFIKHKDIIISIEDKSFSQVWKNEVLVDQMLSTFRFLE